MGKLIEEAIESNKKLFVQFGGQGSPYLKEISKLYQEEPLLKEYFEFVFQCLKKQDNNFEKGKFPFEHGYDLKSWIENPESCPPEEYVMRSSIQAQMILATQMGYYHLATLKGYDAKLLSENVSGCTGHSQGVITATLFSLCLEGKDFWNGLENYIDFMFFLVYYAQCGFPEINYSKEIIDGNAELGEKSPAPMVAILGYSKEELQSMVDIVNQEHGFSEFEKIYVSLFNMPDAMILSASPLSLLKFRQKCKLEMDENKKKFIYLRTTAPLHSPIMLPTVEKFSKDVKDGKFLFPYKPSDLKIPVYSIYDGKDYRNLKLDSFQFAEFLYSEIVVRPLHWNLALHKVFEEDLFAILDFGPSPISTKLTQGHIALNSASIPIYSMAIQKDGKNIFA